MILFFHVPHTGGRGLGRFLWLNSIPYLKIHNDADFAKLSNNDYKYKYFILREPLERGYKEFLHYSARLQTIGHANHLKKSENLDFSDPDNYFGIELSRNLLCKFLLERKDFRIPVSQKDYNYLLTKLSQFTYDKFTDLQNDYLPNLQKIIGIPINVPKIGKPKVELDKSKPKAESNDNKPKNIEIPENIKEIIRKNNEFDIMLYNVL